MQISLFFTSKEGMIQRHDKGKHSSLTAKLRGHKELLQQLASWIMNEMTTSSWEFFFWQNFCARHTNSLKPEPLVLTSFCEESSLGLKWISTHRAQNVRITQRLAGQNGGNYNQVNTRQSRWAKSSVLSQDFSSEATIAQNSPKAWINFDHIFAGFPKPWNRIFSGY